MGEPRKLKDQPLEVLRRREFRCARSGGTLRTTRVAAPFLESLCHKRPSGRRRIGSSNSIQVERNQRGRICGLQWNVIERYPAEAQTLARQIASLGAMIPCHCCLS